MAHAPRASYRLQLGPDLDFAKAAELADYLQELGVSHLYSSPLLQAAPGSRHGYDVVDPTRWNAELGGEAGFAVLLDGLRKHELELLLDVVPNHMSTHVPENRWWWDVLENGPASRTADFFDVDWRAAGRRQSHRILLPILGKRYGSALYASELRLAREDGAFVLHVAGQKLPIAPRSVDGLLREAAEGAASPLLEFLAHAHGALPRATSLDPASVERRHRHKEVLRGLLARLCREDASAAQAVDRAVARWNAEPERLHALLERQNYRLAHWRGGAEQLDYRRFFDVSELVGMRVEERRVFSESHAFVLEQLARGEIAGLRIDHLDGLRDPRGYLDWVAVCAPQAWIVAEKILATGEALPASWPIAGTTGYDFLWRSSGLFVDPTGEPALGALYTELTGDARSWDEAAADGKERALAGLFAADLSRLAELAVEAGERAVEQRDWSRVELERGVAALLVAWPVYRGYTRARDTALEPSARGFVTRALTAATLRRPELDPALLDFLGAVLLRERRGEAETELALRFQQLSSALMAKGVEDTAGYAWPRLAALCEVGCDPGAFAVSPLDFHAANGEAQRRWPRTLLATETHDTKRSGDVRARLALLSEIPVRWADTVRGWFARNARHRLPAGPDAKLEYLLYQTLVGAWPISRERAAAWALKAAREMKERTDWLEPNRAFEEALARFVEALFDDGEFVAELARFAHELTGPGRVNSLAQTLLKLASPGVPDLYQGSEVWDLSLVDPDNRRPVDFGLRRRLLQSVRNASCEQAIAGADEGLPKLFVIQRALAERRRHPDRFGPRSRYAPLFARGAAAERVVAFARTGLVCAVPRFPLRPDGWGDTELELPPGRHRDVFSEERFAGGPVPVARLFARFPVALLSAEAEGESA